MPPVIRHRGTQTDAQLQGGTHTDSQCLAECELIFYGLIALCLLLLIALIIAVVGHIYICTCQSTDTSPDPTIATLNKQLSEKDGTITQLHNNIAENTQTIVHLKTKINDSTNRLAKEMGTKVAADETSVENIGIRNRPMNIADDYQRLRSNEWLDVKTQVDEVIGGDAADNIKYTFLCSIMELTEEVLSAFVTNMYKSLVENNSLQVVLPSSQLTQKSDTQKLPLEISNAIGDYLRNNVDSINIEHFSKAIREKLDDKYKESDMWFKTKDGLEMKAYMKKVITVVLGMVIQRPPMTFKISHEWNGDGSMELNWGSLNPADILTNSGVTLEVTPVHPMLYHGDKLMVKGKVHVTEKQSTIVEVDNSNADQFEDDNEPLIT